MRGEDWGLIYGSDSKEAESVENNDVTRRADDNLRGLWDAGDPVGSAGNVSVLADFEMVGTKLYCFHSG